MNKKLLILSTSILCCVGLYLWWFSDSKVITRNTESLIECFEKETGDGRIGGVMKTTTFKKLLHDQVWLQVNREDIPYASDLGSTLSKDNLVQMHGALVNSPATTTITDIEIEVLELLDDTAIVSLKFHFKTDKLPLNLNHNIDCDLTFKKVDGDWIVSAATLTK